MITAECPLCGDEIKMGLILKYGQRLHCPACEAVLEVVDLSPIQLEWLYFDQYVSEADNIKNEYRNVTECLLCKHELNLPSNIEIGQCVLCPECDGELEVVLLNPIELSWPYGEGYHQPRSEYWSDIDYIAGEV